MVPNRTSAISQPEASTNSTVVSTALQQTEAADFQGGRKQGLNDPQKPSGNTSLTVRDNARATPLGF